MGCTQSKEPTFELPPQKPPQLRSPLPPRIHTPLDRTRHTDVKPSPKRFTGTEFRGPAMQPRDKRKPQLRSPMTPRQPAQPAHKQALRSLDELLMQIDQFDFGEDRNPSRQSFHQIPEEHVYEEEWLMQDSKRTSHRISSFYGEFIDFYDSQSNAPETADLSYYTTVQEDYEYSRLSMMPKPSPINSSETLFDDDKALHMDTREHTLVQENPVKMICAFCEEEIDSHPTKLLGRYWHKHHSECKDCRRPMGVDNFAEIDGFLYCEDHYTTIRGTPIVKKVISLKIGQARQTR
ncbi:hypothetical protein EDD86DRAFT_59759 [Gorgonomyces haynaldii]|nr:hypothetical protein EDD86DRAFT_59759 [Gorgonomyces haynaldii]